MNNQPERTFRIGKTVIDSKESTVCIEGVVCPLQARELSLLEFLSKSPGKCFTREELLTSDNFLSLKISNGTAESLREAFQCGSPSFLTIC